LLRDYDEWTSPLWTGIAFAAAIVVTLGLALAAVVAWWRYSNAAQRASHWLWRWYILRAACVLAIIGLLPVGLGAAIWANNKYRGAVELQRMSDFTMRWIPSRSEVYIHGSIGLGFADALHHLLAEVPTARRIVITSGGGLIGQASKVVSILESKKSDGHGVWIPCACPITP
jgi:hypothetical protein